MPSRTLAIRSRRARGSIATGIFDARVRLEPQPAFGRRKTYNYGVQLASLAGRLPRRMLTPEFLSWRNSLKGRILPREGENRPIPYVSPRSLWRTSTRLQLDPPRRFAPVAVLKDLLPWHADSSPPRRLNSPPRFRPRRRIFGSRLLATLAGRSVRVPPLR